MSARPTRTTTTRKLTDLDNKNSIAILMAGQKYARGGIDQAESVFPRYAAQGGPGGFPTVFPERFPALNHGDLDGTRTIDIDLNKFFGHVTKFKLIGTSPITQTITISKPPPTGLAMMFFVEIEQDANGGHNVSWPAGVIPTPIIDTAANAKTLVALFTDDNGIVYHTQTFGATGGGSSGFENPAVEDLDMNGFDIFDVDEIRGINSALQKIISKTTGWEFEVPDGDTIDFFVDRLNTPTRRFSIQENRIDSNVELNMNGQHLRNPLSVIFGSPLISFIDQITDALRFNTELNDKFQFVFGTGTRFEINDALKQIFAVGMDIAITAGKRLIVSDTVETRNIQLQNLFGNQKIVFTNALQLDHGLDTRLQIDTAIKPFIDLDMQENNILNIRTVQIEEEFPEGFAPTGITDNAILFCRPNASGKTELRVKFQTGNSILIKEEP